MSRLRAEETIVVSGGGKGITAQCAIALAERYHSHFLLLGRTALEAEPAWAQGVEGEAALKKAALTAMRAEEKRPTPAALNRQVRKVRSVREIRRTLQAIEAAGGRADYVSVDVRDGQAVREALAPYRERITALLHGAGLLADKPIQRKTADDFERVVGVKVDGLANLLGAIAVERLRALLFFASVAGFYGNVGQSDYAMANSILDRAAHRLQRDLPQARVLALDWGPWEGGMVTPELRRFFEAQGIPLISIQEGTETLIAALEGDEGPQLVVGGPIAAPPSPAPTAPLRLRRTLTLEGNPFLRHHVIGGHAVLPTVCAAHWMLDAAEAISPGYTFFALHDYRVFKGIVFDESLAESYIAELTPLEAEAEARCFDVRILSELPDGKLRYHYAARITLRRELPPAPVEPFSLPEQVLREGATFYEDGTLFHGPAFRGVEALLDFTPTSLVLRCRLPQRPPQEAGQFRIRAFNPFITDVTLQSLLIWSQMTYGYGGLPLRIAAAEQYLPLPFDRTLYARMQVVAADKRHLVADVTVHDAEGRIHSRILGAEITLSPRLKRLFARNRLEEPR